MTSNIFESGDLIKIKSGASLRNISILNKKTSTQEFQNVSPPPVGSLCICLKDCSTLNQNVEVFFESCVWSVKASLVEKAKEE
jgi:hypothetical protein